MQRFTAAIAPCVPSAPCATQDSHFSHSDLLEEARGPRRMHNGLTKCSNVPNPSRTRTLCHCTIHEDTVSMSRSSTDSQSVAPFSNRTLRAASNTHTRADCHASERQKLRRIEEKRETLPHTKEERQGNRMRRERKNWRILDCPRFAGKRDGGGTWNAGTD